MLVNRTSALMVGYRSTHNDMECSLLFLCRSSRSICKITISLERKILHVIQCCYCNNKVFFLDLQSYILEPIKGKETVLEGNIFIWNNYDIETSRLHSVTRNPSLFFLCCRRTLFFSLCFSSSSSCSRVRMCSSNAISESSLSIPVKKVQLVKTFKSDHTLKSSMFSMSGEMIQKSCQPSRH